MKFTLLIFAGVLAGWVQQSFASEDKPLHIPKIETHQIKSKYVDQTFEIHVMQPTMKKDGSERFPVLYSTDADLNFGSLSDFSYVLQAGRHSPRFILVGIGYPGDARLAMLTLRHRDFYSIPESSKSERLRRWKSAPPSAIEGGDRPKVRIEKLYSGAEDFLNFIRKELFPFIDKNYPVIADDRSYYGYSAGGAFGLYTLFTKPNTFDRYVIGSPVISFNGDDFNYKLAESFIQSGDPINARVFMSVGSEEQFEKAYADMDFVSSFYRLSELLRQAEIPGLQLHTRIFPGEFHMTGWAPAFLHGVPHIMSPADKSAVKMEKMAIRH